MLLYLVWKMIFSFHVFFNRTFCKFGMSLKFFLYWEFILEIFTSQNQLTMYMYWSAAVDFACICFNAHLLWFINYSAAVSLFDHFNGVCSRLIIIYEILHKAYLFHDFERAAFPLSCSFMLPLSLSQQWSLAAAIKYENWLSNFAFVLDENRKKTSHLMLRRRVSRQLI